MEIDRNAAIQEAYNNIKIGRKVQVMDKHSKFVPGVVMDKYITVNTFGSELYIDVLLDSGKISEHYLCYSGFYPRYDLL